MTSDVRPIIEPLKAIDRLLLLAVIVAPFVVIVFGARRSWICAFPLCFVLFYFWGRSFPLFARATFWPMLLLGFSLIPYPILNLALPLAGYLVIYWRWNRFRAVTDWLVWGRLTKATVAWMVPTVIVSCGGLLAWFFLFRPDLSDLVAMVPPGGPITLVGIGIAFSVLNAVTEECVLKGIAWNSLERVFTRDWQINTSQAALFGIIHMGGFPRGWVGVLMATLYGLVLGIIREVSGGLLAPIVAHVFADATIFLVISFISAGVWSVG